MVHFIVFFYIIPDIYLSINRYIKHEKIPCYCHMEKSRIINEEVFHMPMENRKFERIRFVSKAMVTIDNYHFVALTEDLSLSGMLINTDHHIPVGKRVSVSLNLPSVSRSSPVTIEGEVVRNNEQSLAFQFKSLDHDTFYYLKTVIGRKSPYRQKAYGNA